MKPDGVFEAYEAPTPPAGLTDRVMRARAEQQQRAEGDDGVLPGLPRLEGAEPVQMPTQRRWIAAAVVLAAVAAAVLVVLYVAGGRGPARRGPARRAPQPPVATKPAPKPAPKPALKSAPAPRAVSVAGDAAILPDVTPTVRPKKIAAEVKPAPKKKRREVRRGPGKKPRPDPKRVLDMVDAFGE